MTEHEHTARETVFSWFGGALKFGVGALDEIGIDAAAMGLRRVLVITDRQVLATGLPDEAIKALRGAGIRTHLFADVAIEPTDASMAAAHAATRHLDIDGVVALGGGSVIDTAKAVNVLRANGGELLDYVNAPVGAGKAPDRPSPPLIAVPTTAGSGSESSAVCVMDLTALRIKSGISHASLRPRLAIIDPRATLTLPPEATVAAGLDLLSHALESLTTRPFDERPRAEAGRRPTFCGANPLSDPLCAEALRYVGRAFRRVARDGADLAARTDMLLAATLTAVGSSTAGVHIPHACSYAVAAQVSDYSPPGYPRGRPFVPHGHAVASTLPATLRFIASVTPEAQRMAADALAVTPRTGDPGEPGDPGESLVPHLVALMRDIGAPNGLSAFGYTRAHVPALVAGALKQRRLLAGAPRPVDADVIERILSDSLRNW
jgi:alcohol dehydrogenase class IV